jgi:hypothetical protein
MSHPMHRTKKMTGRMKMVGVRPMKDEVTFMMATASLIREAQIQTTKANAPQIPQSA